MLQEEITHVVWMALSHAVFFSGFSCTVLLEPHASGAMATSTATSQIVALSRFVVLGPSGDEM